MEKVRAQRGVVGAGAALVAAAAALAGVDWRVWLVLCLCLTVLALSVLSMLRRQVQFRIDDQTPRGRRVRTWTLWAGDGDPQSRPSFRDLQNGR